MTTKKNHFRAAAALLLAAIILLPGLPARAAETTLTVTVPETLPAVGETFTVTVDLSGNPGLCAAQYTLAFDQSVLSCESAQVGDVLRGTFSATNPQGPEGAIVAAATTTPVTKDGTVGVFTFRVTKGTRALPCRTWSSPTRRETASPSLSPAGLLPAVRAEIPAKTAIPAAPAPARAAIPGRPFPPSPARPP